MKHNFGDITSRIPEQPERYDLMLRARIDNDLHSRLVEEARRQDRSLSSLCRLILRKGLDEVEVSQSEISSQLDLFNFCPSCGAKHIYTAAQVAPVEVWKLPDGRCLVNFWNGFNKAVWVEISEEGRRWLAEQLLEGIEP